MSPPWKFKCFVSERGEPIVCKWYWKLSKKGRANLDYAKDYLATADNKGLWEKPNASQIGDGIYLIRFKDENRTQHRAAGFFIDKSDIFVIAYPGIIEKDDTYKPDLKTYINAVKQRREFVEKSLCSFSRCCIPSGGVCSPCTKCTIGSVGHGPTTKNPIKH